MSEENVEALKDLYEQWTAGDWTDASLFDPYAVAVLPDPTPQPHYGVEALAAYTRRFLEPWEDIRIESGISRRRECRRRFGPPAWEGTEASVTYWQVWTLRDGKFVHGQGFTSRAEALEAAGLSE